MGYLFCVIIGHLEFIDGFDATSIRDIAEMTGLNKSLVHYHYKNKEDLLVSPDFSREVQNASGK